MKKLLVLVLVVALVVVMALTCPDKRAHKRAMMEAIAEYIDEKSDEKGLGDNVFVEFGKGALRTMASAAIDVKVRLDNYYLFNTTHIHLNGKNQILSLGVLGQVITFDKDMLREALEKGDADEDDAKSHDGDASDSETDSENEDETDTEEGETSGGVAL